ncbi:type II secretion system F family protein [Mucilaginibacter sp. L3T2-6]|uniref:type II secretion system F family protein n=1 Tax=Mucilaginibacter sp. L3T2-6 TaxID=3062491 RepID=UPI0026754ADC|nr:type II secretion system F family protein [Mucilaginibacter sp. L3T2-6]MDO3645220.1 type II secretion system F family protein [Mucilaginibacter sp. L3T2-6]MDV6217672.1 type II secretion system F family protein [Mucilaginibacter sp. L3T2-6]
MPSIDISRYNAPKKAPPPSSKTSGGILAVLNKDISFGGSKQLADKKKEYLYLELSSLLQAGVNLKSSLELITTDQKKVKDKTLFTTILNDVIRGDSFSKALESSIKFTAYEVFTIRIGEETGKLNEVLIDLAKFYNNKIKQRRKIVSALTYPVIVLCTSFAAIFFMLKFVVPMFGDVFKRFGGHLPWITQDIINVSQALENNFWWIFLLFAAFGGTIFALRRTENFRNHASRIVLKLPVAGNLIRKIYLARFSNSMRLLITARLPLLNAIALSRKMIEFYPLEASLQQMEADITRGMPLHQSMQKFDVYPAKMVQLIKVGEETNQLSYFFEKIADQYIEEIEYKTSTLSSVMEPLIIIFLGLIVGLILIAMYLPLFQMSNTLQ